jgi:CPA2 family monovalent cation:H+ antiporter-2
MSDLSFSLLFSITLFLTLPFLISLILTRYLRLTPFVGYIFGGVVINLFFKSFFSPALINNFSMIGINLLIFTLGLQINFAQVARLGRFVFVGGIIQLLLTMVSVTIVAQIFGFNFLQSLFFGAAFATASTAIVAKIIQERGEEGSLLGNLAIGLLIFQDITFIPLFIIFSSFAPNESALQFIQKIFFNLIKAGLILFITYYLGAKIIPFVFNKISRVSRELLNLLSIIFILGVLSFFSFFGLSSVLASFIAGILLASTSEHYHVFAEIRPIRDLLVIVFFIFLGLFINPGIIIGNFITIFLFLFILYLIKTIIVFAVFLRFRFHTRTAFSLALMLSGVGEDAFIFLYQGLSLKIIDDYGYNFALAIVLVSFILTPIIITNRDKIYFRLRRLIKKYLPFLEKFFEVNFDRESPNIDVLPLKDHVILCGYGRVGGLIGKALLLANVPFIAIDYNFHTVERARRGGVNIIYGDPTQIDVLDYAQCEGASILILALPDQYSREAVIFHAKKLNPNIIIFARVHNDQDRIKIKGFGVHVVVQAEMEASLSIIKNVLYAKGLTKEEIGKKIKYLKGEY